MNVVADIGIAGIGAWAPGLPGWQAARDDLARGAALPESPGPRPPASALPAGERRRVPDSVLLAVEAAQQACAMSGHDASRLPHVFASAYGDLAINDYLCATLAHTPNALSPTRFHNSVHNAPAGYWSIASGCHENSIALSAGEYSFGAGLLEAAVLANERRGAVLLCAYDVSASGPLRDVIACRMPFAAALLLVPLDAPRVARLRIASDTARDAGLAPSGAVLHPCPGDNPAARSLPMLRALACGADARLAVQAGPDLALELEILF